MRSAQEAALVYTSRRTNLFANSASRAFVIIYNGEIVYQGYSSFGAVLYAFTAGYTAVFTIFTHLCTLFAVVTLYYDPFGIFDKMNESVRANINTNTAANAVGGGFGE